MFERVFSVIKVTDVLAQDGAYETRSRYVISWGLTFALIILWSIPVAFIGLVSNLSNLCQKVSWLAWVCNCNSVSLLFFKSEIAKNVFSA